MADENRPDLAGSKEVTCGKANELFKKDEIRKAHYRPFQFSPPYSDDDPAYVWERE